MATQIKNRTFGDKVRVDILENTKKALLTE